MLYHVGFDSFDAIYHHLIYVACFLILALTIVFNSKLYPHDNAGLGGHLPQLLQWEGGGGEKMFRDGSSIFEMEVASLRWN